MCSFWTFLNDFSLHFNSKNHGSSNVSIVIDFFPPQFSDFSANVSFPISYNMKKFLLVFIICSWQIIANSCHLPLDKDAKNLISYRHIYTQIKDYRFELMLIAQNIQIQKLEREREKESIFGYLVRLCVWNIDDRTFDCCFKQGLPVKI